MQIVLFAETKFSKEIVVTASQKLKDSASQGMYYKNREKNDRNIFEISALLSCEWGNPELNFPAPFDAEFPCSLDKRAGISNNFLSFSTLFYIHNYIHWYYKPYFIIFWLLYLMSTFSNSWILSEFLLNWWMASLSASVDEWKSLKNRN